MSSKREKGEGNLYVAEMHKNAQVDRGAQQEQIDMRECGDSNQKAVPWQ